MKRETKKEIFVNHLLSYIAIEQSHLFSFADSQATPTIKTATGPGDVDLVDALFAQGENIWIRQGEQSLRSQNKIILSCGDFLKFFNSEGWKLTVFLSCLMSVYEVYLWQKDIFLATNKPMATMEELWDKIAGSLMATAAQVQYILLEKGLTDYIVLDGDAFIRLLIGTDSEFIPVARYLQKQPFFNITLYPDWQTTEGREQLLTSLKSFHWSEIRLARNQYYSLPLFKKLFNENISSLNCDVKLGEEYLKCGKENVNAYHSLSVKALEGRPKFAICKDFFEEKNYSVDVATLFQQYTTPLTVISFSFRLPYVKSNCTLFIFDHLISLKIEGFDLGRRKEDKETTQSAHLPDCNAILTLAGGENLEHLSFTYYVGGASWEPGVQLPHNLARLKSLHIMVDMEREDLADYLSLICKYPNLHHLYLEFFNNNTKKINLQGLIKLKKLELAVTPNCSNEITTWNIVIENAPLLEAIMLWSNDEDLELDVYDRINLSYTGCNKLKYIQMEGQWRSYVKADKDTLALSGDTSGQVNIAPGYTELPQRISYFTPHSSRLTMSSVLNAPQQTRPVAAPNAWQCLIMTEDYIDIRNLIWAIYDRLEYKPDSGRLTFCGFVPSTQGPVYWVQKDSALLKPQWLEKIKNGLSVGILQGPISHHTWHLLPMQSPLAVNAQQEPLFWDLASHPPSVLQVLWHGESRRLYVKAIAPLQTSAEVLYAYRPDEHYARYAEDAPDLISEEKILLPPALQDTISREIKTIPGLDFLLDASLSLTAQFNRLIEYCKGFEQKALDQFSGKVGSLEQLLAVLRERRGVCEQRSLAFFVVALYLKIKVLYIDGDDHSRIELLSSRGQRYLLDLGGGIPPTQIRKEDRDPQRLIGSSLPAKQSSDENEASVLAGEVDPLFSFDYQLISYLVKPISLETPEKLWSVAALLKNKTPVIILPAHLTPLAAKFHLVNFIRQQSDDFVYIDEPEDFSQYLHPYAFDEKKQKKQRKSGPLMELIEKGGVIIVNLTRFMTCLAAYQSLFEPEAQILGVPVSKKLVRVVGLAYADIVKHDVFISRCQPYDFPQWTGIPEPLADDSSEVLVRCIKNPDNWQKELFKQVTLEKRGIKITDGWLMKLASSRNMLSNPLTIRVINSPHHDRKYEILCDQINQDGRFYFNAEWHKAPGLRIWSDIGSSVLPDVGNLLKILPDNSTPGLRKQIYLRTDNIYECEYRQVIDEEIGAYQIPGYLTGGKILEEEFYLLQNLNFNQQYMLYEAIKKNQKPVTIRLAPGVCLEGKIGEPCLAYQTSIPSAACRISRDPSYDCKVLLGKYKDHLVIQVSELSTYAELVALLKLEQQTDAPLRFSYQPGLLVSTLQAGRGVILQGELPEFLFLELFSALVPKNPYLDINGKRIDLKPGQLFLIQPDSEKVKQRLIGKIAFANLSYPLPKDPHLVEFLHLISLTPGRGVGNPPLLITMQWLQQCKNTLSERFYLHRHNPLKGLTAAHYLPGSLSYCYLNVLGKYYCRPDDDKPYRLDKLNKLWMKHRIANQKEFEEHLWEALNCFNGKELRDLLGARLIKVIYKNKHTGLPTLEETRFESTYGTLVSLLHKGTIPPPITEQFSKREKQMSLFLQSSAPILNIQGLLGIGKTFCVEQLKASHMIQLYVGWEQLGSWLKDISSGQIKIWFLDDAHKRLPGTFAFLRGLWLSPKSIIYEQKQYILTAQHRAIVTGNPNGYRHAEFLQSETLIFKMPAYSELMQLLKKVGLTDSVMRALVDAFLKVTEINAHGLYSLRDLIDSAERLKGLRDRGPGQPLGKVFFDTCLMAYAYGIDDAGLRESFIQWLITRVGKDYREPPGSLKSLSVGGRSLHIPSDYLPVLNCIELMLWMRQNALQTGREGGYKRGLLVEGPPGVGKSTWFEVYCRLAKLMPAVFNTKSAEEKTTSEEKGHSIYYKLSAGTQPFFTALQGINETEPVVIIEELNDLEPKAEEPAFNRLLTKTKGGCLLFASRNPPINKAIPEATLSRMLKMIIHEPSARSLLLMSQGTLGPILGRKMTAAFYRFKRDHPTTNTRHFFQLFTFKKSTGTEKRSLLKEVLVRALKNYQASPKATPLEKRAIEKLLAAYNEPINFTEADVKIIRGLTGPVASIVGQFLSEGGELPPNFVKQAWEKTEPDWDSLGF